jgi:nucleotide-binding universal stress UspA family protein
MVKKLLLALDCSLPSKRAVEYVAGIVPFLPDCTLTLFTVLTGVPCNEEVLNELLGPQAVELHGDEDHEQEVSQVKQFQAEAARIFAEQRFSAERLTTAIKPLQRGVAQDIIDEARALGCDTIVVGRRGLSKMKQAVLGSVSRDLIQKAEGLTIWVVED